MTSFIRILRFSLSVGIIVISTIFLVKNFSTLFDEDANYVVIRGFISLWAMFGVFFLGISALSMSIVTKGSWRQSHFNRIYVSSILINAAVLSPALAGVLKYQLESKAHGYVQCEDLSRSSRRYSSATYATTADECQELAKLKQKHNE
ncbi:hypothetical protein CAG64_06510 [Vibrio sp. V38_P2S17PM301]|uniref:hypothetical protein n=1 Tax=Vibrio sp. V38_P2S17PM301 TaxID=1938689 RepID=UPI001360F73E|nr:hypothetical protein [Vibrio sp. V38_P2S17PM301]NAX25118.1 hypothetical protein [Vibrio sp. V38_P2S17PM301]